MRRLPAIVGVLAALLACGPAWLDDEALGVEVEWRGDDAVRPWGELGQAICDAALASPDPRLLYGAAVVILPTKEELEGACLQSGVTGCWHPDYDDEDGAGVIYIGPPGDGGALSDATLRHELGHLARSRWRGNADTDHSDEAWWVKYDTTPVRCE